MFKKLNAAKTTKSFWSWSKVTLGAEGLVFLLVIAYIGIFKEPHSRLVEISFYGFSFFGTIFLVWLRQELAIIARQAIAENHVTNSQDNIVLMNSEYSSTNKENVEVIDNVPQEMSDVKKSAMIG